MPVTVTSSQGKGRPAKLGRSPANREDPGIAKTEQVLRSGIAEDRVQELLTDAAEFFKAHLWDSESSRAAREALADVDLEGEVIRAFGVGYAPIGRDVSMNHLGALGYSTDELVAAGLASRSVRGRAHARFHSRVMFPIRDRQGTVLGFAALGTHLGASWPLWVTSPDDGIYRRSEAVFGIDRAADRIAKSRTVAVRPDCIEVLKAHQDGQKNAVAVHTSSVTHEQVLELAAGVRGGVEALELELPPGMRIESDRDQAALESVRDPAPGPSSPAASRPRHFNLKRLVLVIATTLAAVNLWTGAPLLAVWVGSQAQSGRLLSMWGVVTVVAVLGVLAFLLGWALIWLSARYDELTGRPKTAGQTSPWHRAKRGDRVQDIRSRYGVSAPEKVVAASVAAGVLAFEIWFFFFAGPSI